MDIIEECPFFSILLHLPVSGYCMPDPAPWQFSENCPRPLFTPQLLSDGLLGVLLASFGSQCLLMGRKKEGEKYLLNPVLFSL